MTAELVIINTTRPRNCWPEKEHQNSETTAEAPAQKLVKEYHLQEAVHGRT